MLGASSHFSPPFAVNIDARMRPLVLQRKYNFQDVLSYANREFKVRLTIARFFDVPLDVPFG
jgi:hypothetical protein